MPPGPGSESLLARYVAIGNSITAGFQSLGINDSTQLEAYPVLLAGQFGLTVGRDMQLPLLNPPGCPPPIVNALTGERLAGATGSTCALRATPPPPFINNVAVPGAAVIDVLTNRDPASGPNVLTTLFLGGRTQLQAAAQVEPTFATVWIGNNDVLGAALARDAGRATSVDAFRERYAEMLDSLAAAGLRGAVLIGVARVTNIPSLIAGTFYLDLERMGMLPDSFDVQPSCDGTAQGGVGDIALVPYTYAIWQLADSVLRNPTAHVVLDCADDTQVLTQSEVAVIEDLVTQYNAFIQSEAARRGWAYVDVNLTLDSLRMAGAVPATPNLGDPTGAFFGPLFSLDGIHPNRSAHLLIADHIIDAINARYGTALSHPPRP